VFRRIEQWGVVILLVILIGGHWAILQSVAWTGMLLHYSQNATIDEAWTKTFDGKHPCRLCKAVRAGKAAEKKQEMLKLETKFEFSFVAGTAWLFPPKPFRHFTPVPEHAEVRADEPLLLPPIAA
jgi:hypothetical protein